MSQHRPELKKNATNDLIIYIVGSKADLNQHRQVTEDRARLSLHTWFPPPRAPTPPAAPEPEQISTFSYIRPRFTSLTSSRSVPFSSSFSKPAPSTAQPSNVESASRPADLKRSQTTTSNGRANGVSLQHYNSITPSIPASSTTTSLADSHSLVQSRFASPLIGRVSGYQRILDERQRQREEEDENSECSWGLEKDMKLFEVSAKDDRGSPAHSFLDLNLTELL